MNLLDRWAARRLLRKDPTLLDDLQSSYDQLKWWEVDSLDRWSRVLACLGVTVDPKSRSTQK